MGNQFNGYGDTVYLKGDMVKLPTISQDNVTLTPDYSQYALSATGGNPTALNPESINETINMMMGAVSSLNQATITKNSSDGSYAASFSVSSQGFIADSYSIMRNTTKNTTEGKLDYFAVTTNSNLNIREERSEKSDILGTVEIGGSFQVITLGGTIVTGPDDDDSSKPKWVKATNGTVEGWVSEPFIREDKKSELKLSTYGLDKNIDIKVNFKDSTSVTESGIPSEKWFMVGGGQYAGNCKKVDEKWCVAVGPAIFDSKYSEKGLCYASDIKPFSKFIKVHLRHKTTGVEITKEFCICDIKAHTFNRYPYNNADRNAKLLSQKGADFFKSETVDNVKINPGVRSGVVQTGIRYVNADNGTVVARIKKTATTDEVNNMDFSIIEFCGDTMSDKALFSKYELVSIETNYEKSTRGKRYSYSTGQEIKDEKDD